MRAFVHEMGRFGCSAEMWLLVRFRWQHVHWGLARTGYARGQMPFDKDLQTMGDAMAHLGEHDH